MTVAQACESVFHCWVQKPGSSAVTWLWRDGGKSASWVPMGFCKSTGSTECKERALMVCVCVSKWELALAFPDMGDGSPCSIIYISSKYRDQHVW